MKGVKTDKVDRGYIKENDWSSGHEKNGECFQWQPLSTGEGSNSGYIQGLVNGVLRAQLRFLQTIIL